MELSAGVLPFQTSSDPGGKRSDTLNFLSNPSSAAQQSEATERIGPGGMAVESCGRAVVVSSRTLGDSEFL